MAKQTFTTGQVLTAAQMTSLQQTAMLGGAASAKTASYTLVAADAGSAISMSNASATTITVNTALFAAGDTVHITNLGAGVCTITAGTATVNSSASLALAQYESGFLDFTSTSAAIFVKGAGAAAASGGMTLLSTTTLSGASTTISSIDQTYTTILIIATDIIANFNGENLRIDLNASGNTHFGALVKDATTTVSGFEYNNTTIKFGESATSLTNNRGSQLVFNLYNYTSTGTKFYAYSSNTRDDSNVNKSFFGAGTYDVASAVTSIKFTVDSASWSGGTVLVYGVK